MKITVTQEDINGAGLNAYLCPIARSIQRHIEMPYELHNVRVERRTVRVFNIYIKNIYEENLPEEAQNFIYDYDKDKPVVPFNFEIPDIGEWRVS